MEPWIQTFSGKKLDFTDPTEDMIDINDIAQGLSLVCRFSGQCKAFYSVAEHSCNVSRIATAEDKLQALLHDASEAYMSDIVSPLKQLIPEYKTIEKRLQETIYRKFRIYRLNDIKHLDTMILHYEAIHMTYHPSVDNWVQETDLNHIELEYLSPERARCLFLKQFFKLFY